MRAEAPQIVGPGKAIPFGLSVHDGHHQFAIYIDNAESVRLLIHQQGSDGDPIPLPLNSESHRTGDVWHALVSGLHDEDAYCYEVTRFGKEKALLLADPYAVQLIGHQTWGDPGTGLDYRFARVGSSATTSITPLSKRVSDRDLVIYELHVRGFTRHKTSQVQYPGTFAGLIEKIPYLKALGVNAVELLPIAEFDELAVKVTNPTTGEPLKNLWGYQPLNWFTPKAGYAHGDSAESLKKLVNELHANGMEVILDVVYNHTGEGDAEQEAHSFRGLADSSYYLKDKNGDYFNFSGCGNAVNTNQPLVTVLIVHSLRHWVTEYGVDGFRFDLGAIFSRGTKGQVLDHAPVIAAISTDPVLKNVRLIAEAWDAAGLYQLGHFAAPYPWHEWNGRYRDDVRDFVRGEKGKLSALAARLTGSADLYSGTRDSRHSINFITAHDGFPLRDLVSYNEKHNQANGEDGRDGESHNRSWNCGVEGETQDAEVNALRLKQMKNLLLLLFMSRGTPMLLSGDELGRSQGGNNNAYCQDNEISWLNWQQDSVGHELLRFVQGLIRFRLDNPLINHQSGVGESLDQVEYIWHGYGLNAAHWGEDSHWLGMHLKGSVEGAEQADLYLMVNNHSKEQRFEIPLPSRGTWSLVVDTAATEKGLRIGVLENQDLEIGAEYSLAAYSSVLLRADSVASASG